MKVLHIHLRSGQSMRRILQDDQISSLMETVELGLQSRRGRRILAADDFQGNPFILKLDEISALHLDDFDLNDL